MVVFQDFIICIELEPESNILCVRWLDKQAFKMADFKLSFHTLMGCIEKYQVKKLVARSSRGMIHLPDEEYISVISLLQSGLAHSKIEKLARISTDNSEQDQKCIKHFEHVLNEMQLEIDFRNFSSRKAALRWLNEKVAA